MTATAFAQASRLVPFTTANGSVIYRKPASTTTTVAQPKKTIPQPAPVNLTTANAKYLDAFMRVPNNLPAEPKDSLSTSESIATKEAQFALKYPKIAKAIGVYHPGSLNLSTVAVNFMKNSELSKNIDGAKANDKNKELDELDKGSDTNAFRHVTWQALITKSFGKDVAEQAGFAHEAEPFPDINQETFNKIDDADQVVDLLNNAIGREIGEKNQTLSNRELALKVLEAFRNTGFWTVEKNSGKTFSVRKTIITAEQYDLAYTNISVCDEYGHSPDTVKRRQKNSEYKIENQKNIKFNSQLS